MSLLSSILSAGSQGRECVIYVPCGGRTLSHLGKFPTSAEAPGGCGLSRFAEKAVCPCSEPGVRWPSAVWDVALHDCPKPSQSITRALCAAHLSRPCLHASLQPRAGCSVVKPLQCCLLHAANQTMIGRVGGYPACPLQSPPVPGTASLSSWKEPHWKEFSLTWGWGWGGQPHSQPLGLKWTLLPTPSFVYQAVPLCVVLESQSPGSLSDSATIAVVTADKSAHL